MNVNMRRWDGYDKDRRYKIPDGQINYWEMTIDDEGTIYYMSYENPRRRHICCVASQLSGHLRYLCGFNQAMDTNDMRMNQS